MFHRSRLALVALLACGLCLAVVGPSGGAAAKLEGKPAPALKADFALNGKPVAPADLKGKVVLLDFWGPT